MPSNQEFQCCRMMNSDTVAMEGLHRGRMIRVRVVQWPAPSMKADSEMASGRPFMKFIIRMI